MMGFNRVMVWLLRSPFHRLISNNILVLRVVGVKSGRAFDVPVNYVIVERPHGVKYLVASQRDRTWWRNLRNRVGVELSFQGKRVKAHAQAFESVEAVTEGLREYFIASPKSARYFDLRLNPDGTIPAPSLGRVAEDRVVIWIDPPESSLSR
jgi:hypothetical protein